MRPAKHNATYADVENAPKGMIAELIDGKLYLFPRPVGEHQRAASNLEFELRGPFDLGRGGPGGWIILPEVELRISPVKTVAPDLSGWLRTHFTEPLRRSSFEVPPDWLCEVLSRGTRAYDRGEKLELYFDHGVSHVWLVDPEERSLEVFARGVRGYELLGTWSDDETVEAEPFEAYRLSLTDVWRE